MLPDGSIHDGLAGLKKDNRGPSLDQLLVGAEGTLGIVTAARLRLVPAIARAASPGSASQAPLPRWTCCARLEAVTDRVEGFEILPGRSLDAALAHIPRHALAAWRASSLACAGRGDVRRA